MSAAETASAWLARELQDGQPHAAGGVLTRGTEAGYSEMALRRAARSLGVKYSEASLGARSTAPKIVIWKLQGAPPMKAEERPRRIKTRHTINGVIIETDRASYGLLMVAISDAIDKASDQEYKAALQGLRTALGRAG